MKNSENIKEGDVVTGKVTGIQSYGIFVKLNNECSGLVHVTELEKLESENPIRFYKIGQIVKVKILRIKSGGKQAVLRIHRPIQKRRLGASGFETESGFGALEKEIPIWIEAAKKR
ncbi:MAG: S1 RNA-binding domain-containing protein [Turicibacter sp.]|nr:S1 RNA-binding domain-containing protein [Turicibacter sp.]